MSKLTDSICQVGSLSLISIFDLVLGFGFNFILVVSMLVVGACGD